VPAPRQPSRPVRRLALPQRGRRTARRARMAVAPIERGHESRCVERRVHEEPRRRLSGPADREQSTAGPLAHFSAGASRRAAGARGQRIVLAGARLSARPPGRSSARSRPNRIVDRRIEMPVAASERDVLLWLRSSMPANPETRVTGMHRSAQSGWGGAVGWTGPPARRRRVQRGGI
jgi:hypothetical protein